MTSEASNSRYSIHHDNNHIIFKEKLLNGEVNEKKYHVTSLNGGISQDLTDQEIGIITKKIFKMLKEAEGQGYQLRTLEGVRFTPQGLKMDRKSLVLNDKIEQTPEYVLHYKPKSYDQTFKKLTYYNTLTQENRKEMAEFIENRKQYPEFFLKIRDLIVKFFFNSLSWKETLDDDGNLIDRELENYGYQWEKIALKMDRVNKIESSMRETVEQMKAIRDFQSNDMIQRDPDAVYVPEAVLNRSHSEFDENQKKLIAEVAVGKDGHLFRGTGKPPHKNVEVLQSNGMRVVPIKIKDGVISERGRVTPSSFRTARPEKANRLVNCYITTEVIRHGVANTKEKANDLVSVTRQLNNDMGRQKPSVEKKLRMASHQLNTPSTSFENELQLVSQQNKSLAFAEDKAKNVEIAHINSPSNRSYEWTGFFDKIGLGGLFPGEKNAHKQNVEGIVTYLLWAFEDLVELSEKNVEAKAITDAWKDDVEAIKQKRSEIIALNRHIVTFQDEINSNKLKIANTEDENLKNGLLELVKETEGRIEELEKQISKLRTELKEGSIIKILSAMHGLKQSENPEIKAMQQTFEILQQLTAMQFELPGAEIHRGQELMMYMFLDDRLGVISAINCTVGLDRTGFVHAMTLALKQTKPEERYDLVMNWEKRTVALNKLMVGANYDMKDLKNILDSMADQNEADALRKIMKFRSLTAENILKISMPITATSTGLVGLKWHKGMIENLIPLNFLPPVLKIVKQGNEIEDHQILTYDDEGQPKGLTEIGHQLITQLSPFRD